MMVLHGQQVELLHSTGSNMYRVSGGTLSSAIIAGTGMKLLAVVLVLTSVDTLEWKCLVSW